MNKNEGVEGLQPLTDIVETHDEEGNDTTNWKELAQGLLQQGRAWEGVAKRNHSDLEKLRSDPRLTRKEEPPKASQDGRYGELAVRAFLNSEGVPKEDHEWVLEEAKNTGKSEIDLLGFKYVQEELKNRKEARATKEALPSGSKRSAPASGNSAEYWYGKLQRGEITLGQVPDIKLRREVRKMKERASGGGSSLIVGSIR